MERTEVPKKSLKQLIAEARIERDLATRNAWMKAMKSSAGTSSVLVGDGIALSDVVRWLNDAVETLELLEKKLM